MEWEILCVVTVADPLDDHSDEPGVSGQQVQAQPGTVQQVQDRADRYKALEAKPPKQYTAIQKYVPSVTLNLLLLDF